MSFLIIYLLFLFIFRIAAECVVGRPSSTSIYISTHDNTFNHGPGSQGSRTEADACFGKLYDQESKDLAMWMLKQVRRL